MDLKINGIKYPVVIEKKMRNRNTYIRVTKDLEIKVTTNYFTTNRFIVNLVNYCKSNFSLLYLNAN